MIQEIIAHNIQHIHEKKVMSRKNGLPLPIITIWKLEHKPKALHSQFTATGLIDMEL